MSGTKQLEQTIVGKHPGEDDPDAQRFFNQKIVLPVVQSMRNTMNQLVGDVLESTESQGILAKYGVILADATDGSQVLTLLPPSQSHRSYFFAKTDGTANIITLQVADGSLISGAATLVLTDKWQGAILVSDADQYVAFATAQAVPPPAADITIGPFTLSADQTTYSPVGWSSARYVLLNPTIQTLYLNSFDANVTVKRKTIINVATSDSDIRIRNNSFIEGTAANRVLLRKSNHVYLIAQDSVDIWYDDVFTRWRPI